MRILIVSRYKDKMNGNISPFVSEQGETIAQELRQSVICHNKIGIGEEQVAVDYFLIKGSYIKAVKALKEKIREYKPDVVHAHFGLSGVTAVMATKWTRIKVPLVITFHNGETLNRIVNVITSLFSLYADYVIYVAQHIYDLCYFKTKDYSIIPCGVPMEQMIITSKEEARKQLGWEPDKKYIIFGGAFDNARKNYTLLRTALELLKGCNDWHSVEGGEQLGDIVCIEMKGLTRTECVLRMCAADLFALPSHSEGSPQALKEAMAVNCPCIATDITDVKKLFGEEPGHFLLRNPRKTHERWDADERSLDEMVDLLNDALQFEGRTNGREKIIEMKLTNEQVAKRIVEIYRKVTNKNSE